MTNLLNLTSAVFNHGARFAYANPLAFIILVALSYMLVRGMIHVTFEVKRGSTKHLWSRLLVMVIFLPAYTYAIKIIASDLLSLFGVYFN